MKNRKQIWILLLVCVFVFTLVGCGGKAEPEVEVEFEAAPEEVLPEENLSEEAPGEELYFDIDAYSLSGAMLQMIYPDGSVEETGGLGLMAYAGDTVGDAVTAAQLSTVEPVLEGDTFEGWMLYETVVTVDEDGWENYTYELRSGDTFYTTEEILAMAIPEYPCMFVAKWASIPMESYFAEEDYMFEEGVTTGSLTLLGNGGTLYFQPFDGGDPYDSVFYAYWLEEGQCLNDVTASGEWDAMAYAEKEGAEFSHWTVFSADSTYFSSEPDTSGGNLSFPFDETMEGYEYIVLVNAFEYQMPYTNEELNQMIVNGENLIALAIWQ